MKLRTRWLGIGTALMVTGIVLPASAQGKPDLSSVYGMLMDGYDDDAKDQNNTTNDGSANEQIQATWFMDDGVLNIGLIWMNSNTEVGNYQCHFANLRIAGDGSDPEVTAMTQLTNYANGTRQCNHPAIAHVSAGGQHAYVVAWGTDNFNSNPQTYLSVVGLDGEFMYHPNNRGLLISNDANNNEGAPDVQWARPVGTFMNLESTARLYAVYGSTNNNDRTMTVLVDAIYENGAWDLDIIDRSQTLAPTNQPRPSIGITNDGMYGIHCNAVGNNRPPENGCYCAMIDLMTGDKMWTTEYYDSEVGAYCNQVTARVYDDVLYLHQLTTDGTGKDNGGKGATIARTEAWAINTTGMSRLGSIQGVGAFSSHSSIAVGPYGDKEGQVGIAVIDAPIIAGAGQPTLDVIKYNKSANYLDFDQVMDRWTVSPYNGDSGDYQNYYGGNPNTQGRGFPKAFGPAPNPDYGKDVGFKPWVKSFWIVPHVAAMSAEEKLAAFWSLVPAEVDVSTPPTEPTEPNGPEENPQGGPNNPGEGTPGTNTPGTSGIQNATAGGCSVATHDSDWNGFALALLGLGMIGLATRRREEEV